MTRVYGFDGSNALQCENVNKRSAQLKNLSLKTWTPAFKQPASTQEMLNTSAGFPLGRNKKETFKLGLYLLSGSILFLALTALVSFI